MAPPAGAPSPGGAGRRRLPPLLLVMCWTALLGPMMWHMTMVGWPEVNRGPGSRVTGSGVTLGGAASRAAAGRGAVQGSSASRPAHRNVLEGSGDHLMHSSEQADAAAGHAGWLGRADNAQAVDAGLASSEPAAGGPMELASSQRNAGVLAFTESMLSSQPEIFLFIGILSGAGQEQRRAAVREAWSQAAQQPGQVRNRRKRGHPKRGHTLSPAPLLSTSATSICIVQRIAPPPRHHGFPLVGARRWRHALCSPSGSARRRWMRSRPSMTT